MCGGKWTCCFSIIFLLHTFSLHTYKDSSSLQEFTVAACHPGYVLEGEYCVCNHSHTDIFRCDESNRYIYIRVCQKQQPLYIRMYTIYAYICICILYVYTTNVIAEININCTKLTMYYNYNSSHYFILFSIALECMQMFDLFIACRRASMPG